MRKHGAERHFVRPDAVHRSSILQAIPGYQPVSNAHQVAARFTAAPYFATFHQPAMSAPVSGLGEAGLGRRHRRVHLLRGVNGLGYYLGDDGTVVATTTKPASPMDNIMSLWTKLKIRWQAFKTQLTVPHAAAAVRAVAAASPSQQLPPGPTPVDQIPPGGQGGYGVGPASQNMAIVGARITAGMVQSGDDVALPAVAMPEYTAGMQIRPDVTGQPGQLSQELLVGEPPYVSDAANAAAMARFIGLRTMWWK